VPRKNGWFQLRHVLTGRYMRLVPPPSPEAWVVRAENDPEQFGKQTWFRLETSSGGEVDVASRGPMEVHLRCHSTGAYINYRGRPIPTESDFIRGHGNAMSGSQWAAAPRSASTKMFLEGLDLAALLADRDKWAPTRDACLAPCSNASAAAALARSGGIGWSEVCWKHYAETTCNVMMAAHGQSIGAGGTETAHLLKARWARLDCEKYIVRPPKSARQQQRLPVPPPRVARMGSAAERQQPAPHCVPLVDNMLLLLVSDRPNQFLCHYFESAMLHGLNPTVLGWDDSGWASEERKPWTYYLGGKLVLPLEYLERCSYPDDAIVLFTDHDVVFQGGAAELKARYGRAVKAANGAPLIFSAESESYPRELKPLYPRSPSDPSKGPAEFLNSGMWMGTVGAAKALLKVMTGVYRGEKMETLLRHYHRWGKLDTRSDPIPPAYNENDQVKYAGLYVAQEMAAACSAGRQYGAKGSGCFKFLHDGGNRCSPGCRSGDVAKRGAPMPRMAIDRSLLLFENMYHAGAHTSGHDGKVSHSGVGTPLVVHFNGPAKVIFEPEWRLSWDATAGKTPVLSLVEGMRTARSEAQRRAATAAFEHNVTFLSPWLAKVEGMGPLRFSCEVPW
jgi:hypothetical protein